VDRRRSRDWIALALASSAVACSGPLDLGRDLIWFAENEGADTSEWSADSAGGLVPGSSGSSAELSNREAHGGAQSLLLVTPASGEDSGARLYRSVPLASEAYYSAWYLIPESYVTRSYFTIMKFHSQDPGDELLHDRGIDINVRDLSDGRYVLYVLHHDGAFLQPPLALPTPIVPVGRWFHVEVFFRATLDATGRISVWLDGRPVYDLGARPTLVREAAYFSVCNLLREAEPPSVELFVDDVAVSRSRVTESGVLR
jgi:hypothetical protein